MGGTPTKLAYNTFRPVASFNNPITVNDLQNKLKVIVFRTNNENSRAFVLNIVNPIGGSSTDFELTNENDDLSISMRIVGKTIVASDMSGDNVWIFDLDYDRQNTKVFSKSDGYYYVQMPQVLNDPEGFALVQIDRDSATIKLAVGNDYTYPDAYYPNTQIIDASDAFNAASQADNSRANNEAIANLILLIAQMEYVSLDGIDSSGVMNEFDEGPALSWNLYSDGNPRPMPALVMTSRMSRSCPILASEIEAAGENGILLCKFNREPAAEELVNNLEAILDGGIFDIIPAYIDDGTGKLMIEDDILEIRGNSVYVVRNPDTNIYSIYDVDYNRQHRRELVINEASEDHNRYITLPIFLGVSAEDLIVQFYKSDDDPAEIMATIFKNVNDSLLTYDQTTGDIGFTALMPSMNVNYTKILLEAIMRLEFNWDGHVEVGTGPAIDSVTPFNLLTDNIVDPQ